MTIDEVIENEKGIIKNEQFFQDTHIVFTDDAGEDVTIEMLNCDDTECIEESLEISRENLEYHKQLVAWLEELKAIKDGAVFYSNKPIEDIVLEARAEAIKEMYNEILYIESKFRSMFVNTSQEDLIEWVDLNGKLTAITTIKHLIRDKVKEQNNE